MTFTISPEIISNLQIFFATASIGFMGELASCAIQAITRHFAKNPKFAINRFLELIISFLLLIIFIFIGGTSISSIAAAIFTKTLIIAFIGLNEYANFLLKEYKN